MGHSPPDREAGQGQTAEDDQGVKMGKGGEPLMDISREAEFVFKPGPGYQASYSHTQLVQVIKMHSCP